MIYRIDLQHFLTHAIDHFTLEQLTHFQYAIISAKINNGRSVMNTEKINELYPTPDIVISYDEYKDDKILEKMYFEMLEEKGNKDYMARIIYQTFINPLMKHFDIMIICDEKENPYITCLCKYLHENFSIDVIDLNELFTTGHTGAIYIDRDKIWDKAVDIRRTAGKEMIKTLEQSRDGKLKLLNQMNKKEKIEKCKELGIKINKSDIKDIDKILIDDWVENDE